MVVNRFFRKFSLSALHRSKYVHMSLSKGEKVKISKGRIWYVFLENSILLLSK